MFVCTLKASGLKFFAAVAVSVAVLSTIIAVLPGVGAETDVAFVNTDYSHISDVNDMAEFLKGFGYEIDPEPVEVFDVTIPGDFDAVFEKYNEIQRSQGLNLKRYSGKNATVYTYKVTNYGNDADVFATLFILNQRVIAGDVCSHAGEGFVHGFKKPQN